MDVEDKKIGKGNRPKLIVQKSKLERALNSISTVLTITIWTYLIVSWNSIPDIIPMHFGFTGKPDSWGSRGGILIIPIIGSILYFILTYASKNPQYFNYTVKITGENAKWQCQNARTLLSWMLTEIITMFLFLEWQIINIANGNSSGLGASFIPVFLAIILGTTAIYSYKMYKLR